MPSLLLHRTCLPQRAYGAPGRTAAARASRAPHVVAMASSSGDKVGVLFVCLGNICRSPSAEAVFKSVVDKAGLKEKFDIDSCGTGGGNSQWYVEGGWSYHEGDAADERMTRAAQKRGVYLTSRSRPLTPEDFTRFDYIIGMDGRNIATIEMAARYWKRRGMDKQSEIPDDFESKLTLMTDYCTKFKNASEVPDPYYGGPEGFEKVLDLLDDACVGLLNKVKAEKGV